MTMEIQPGSMEKMFALYQELDDLQRIANDCLAAAKEGSRDRKCKITRNGKQVEVPEHALWTEVWHLGNDSDAGKYLAPKYPAVFEAYANVNAKATELQVYVQSEFGIDYKAIKMSDIFRIAQAVFDMNWKQRMN